MPNNANAHRKRGVRASRAKLTEALTAAGLRTQAALAERIADLEGLDSAPRDAVSRVFRELPVEATTLARVAYALGVEAHTLYLTSDEVTPDEAAPDTSVVPRTRGSGPGWWLTAAIAVAAILAAGFWLFGRPGPIDGDDETFALPSLGLGRPTLVVMPIDGDTDAALADGLRGELARHFSVATDTASVLTQSLDAGSAAETLRSDVVIEGDIAQVGRLSGLRFFLYAGGVRRQVWAESLPTVALSGRRGEIAERVSRAVRHAAGLPTDDGIPHFPLVPVQDDYLQGEFYLDEPSNELNIKRAQSRFEAALRQDANYARAHAGLCQTLLEELWMSDEERALTDASRACGQALQLAPDDPVVATAHAHFLRRTGRNDEAIERYEAIVGTNPLDSAALAGLSSSLLAAYRQTGDEAQLDRARATAEHAADVDPYVWKPLFALATMEWFAGDVAGAIAASEAAIARDENEYVLANLGTFYLCDGAFENARDAYLRAQELAPRSYVGDEFLGMAHYFLGDFEESARLRQRAIDAVAEGEPEIHEMWGNLGDSYRQTGDRQRAIDAYLHAAEIAERDHLRGTAPVADRAARAYYYTVLGTLDASLVPDAVRRSIDDEIDAIAAELSAPTAHRRMAQTYLLRGETEKARAALERSMATCRGYGRLPDLKELSLEFSHLRQRWPVGTH